MLETRLRQALPADVDASDTVGFSLVRGLATGAAVAAFVFAFALFATRSLLVAGACGGALFAASGISNLRYRSRLEALRGRLAEPAAVEVLELRPARVLEVEAPGSTGPALCFDCGDGRLLLLVGQWLLEPGLYRAPAPEDPLDDRFNGLPDPHGFPAEHFALHRWRGEARPFWIEPRGRYVEPEPSRVRLTRDVDSAELLPGSADTAQEDLDRAPGS